MKRNLLDTKKIHMVEMPYSCDQCEKTFTTNSALTNHRRIQIGERTYSCKLCDKHYTTSSHISTYNKSLRHLYIMNRNSNTAPTTFFNCGEVIKEEEIFDEDPLYQYES